MIAQTALLCWIFICVAMFALLPARRAFLLSYVIGYLLLPVETGALNLGGYEGSIFITQSLRIDKITACNIGALLGTAIFASHAFARFRFHWVDGAFVAALAGAFLTSVVNGAGAKDGISHTVEWVRQYAPLMLLARIYITSATDLYEALRAVIGGAFLYSFLCLGEWRFSPQTHRMVYGYFQHAFEQFERYGHFRPIGFLHHAIECSFFMGTSAALAGWMWYRGVLKPLWGVIPGWVVVLAVFAGLASTLTFSGYAAFLITAAIFCGMALLRAGSQSLAVGSRWALLILPVASVIWMTGRFTGQIDAQYLLSAARYFDATRSESLAYRLDTEEIHFQAIKGSLLLGKGAENAIVTMEDGRSMKAVDAWWLITLIFYGVTGLAAWFLVWVGAIVETIRRWPKLTPDLHTLTAAVSVLVGAQFIDFLFNGFPSPFLFILSMGAIATLQAYRPAPQVQFFVLQEEPAVWPEGAVAP